MYKPCYAYEKLQNQAWGRIPPTMSASGVSHPPLASLNSLQIKRIAGLEIRAIWSEPKPAKRLACHWEKN